MKPCHGLLWPCVPAWGRSIGALVLVSAVAAGGAAGPSGAGEAGGPAASPRGDEEIVAMLEPIRARAGVPALTGALVSRGEGTRVGAVGTRKAGDTTPVTASDRWHLGSCTKAMTATLAEIVAADRKLDLDAPVARVFHDLEVHREWEGVTLRRWLAHRGRLNGDYPQELCRWLRKRETGPRAQRARVAAEFLRAPPPREDSGYVYANAGFDLVGAAIERVADQDFETLMAERLFAPLGIESGGFGPPGRPDEIDHPWGHRRSGGSLVPMSPGFDADNPPSLSPAGRAAMTLADWGRFVALHLGERVLLRRHGRPPMPLLGDDALARLHTPADGESYVGGWIVTKRDWSRGPVLTHAGSNTLWTCVCWLAPTEGFAVLAATNVGGPDAARACDEVAAGLLRLHARRAVGAKR